MTNMINTVTQEPDKTLTVAENILNHYPDHVTIQRLQPATRALKKDEVTEILTQYGLNGSFFYNEEEIFMMACFVDGMFGMKMILWDETNFGEFVSAHRLQLIHLLVDDAFELRTDHVQKTLQKIELEM